MSERDTRELLSTRKRNVTLTFNLNDQMEREVYEWCSEHDDSCSAFIKKVLSQYKEYREFVQTVSKLHEMMPMMQQIFPAVGTNSPVPNPLQQMSSQVNQKMNSQVIPQMSSHIQPFSNVPPKTPSSTSELPSRSARHGGSKRRRTSMPME
ncbi:hypothetical protein MK805_17140 [Shimazuella sp. AN120528]|uniref:hypothetical protein n=1 Tax=Shimazuella soli TaxID=1892854 RepID=UPI001F0F1DCC|nr:hypothetical protein [Shimazuella soli]MCH5586663.1 hypothetical protein [Shimazuella soli]